MLDRATLLPGRVIISAERHYAQRSRCAVSFRYADYALESRSPAAARLRLINEIKLTVGWMNDRKEVGGRAEGRGGPSEMIVAPRHNYRAARFERGMRKKRQWNSAGES